MVIETAVRMGDKAFVTINGQTYPEGDLINDVLIEKIENEEVTFRVGKPKLLKMSVFRKKISFMILLFSLSMEMTTIVL